MKLEQYLCDNSQALKERWLDAMFRTYPLDTVGFMRKKRDQFQNPVGHRMGLAADALVDALLKPGLDSEEIAGPVDDIVRIRAVQDFTPARAIGVFYLLKSIVRDMVKGDLADGDTARELLQFESKIDTLVLVSLDVYVQCKAQIYEMRIREINNKHHMLLKRAKMVCEPAEEPDTPITHE